MHSRSDKLEQFKTDIDLRVVAAELGYEINLKKSSRGSTAMDHVSGDRILVAMAPDGHYVYCSVRDPADAGSVIDQWQRSKGGSLGSVHKALRQYLVARGLAPTALVQARFERFKQHGGDHACLCNDWKISTEKLASQLLVQRRLSS